MNELKLHNNLLNLMDYSIEMEQYHRIIISDDTAVGKTFLNKELRTYCEQKEINNVLIYIAEYDYDRILRDIEARNKTSYNIIILDTCDLKVAIEKRESLIDYIYSDKRNYYIIIEQGLSLFSTPFYKLYDKVFKREFTI